MDISIIAFKNLYELLKQAIDDVRKISSKYRKGLYLERIFPELYSEIKRIHSDYLTTFSDLKYQYWMGQISFQQLQQKLELLQYTNKTVRLECVCRLDVMLTENWSNQAYNAIKAMRSYFGATYELNNDERLKYIENRIIKVQHLIASPNYNGNRIDLYYPYESGFSECVLMFRIVEYLNTSDLEKKEQLLGEILKSENLPIEAVEANRLLRAGYNPITTSIVSQIMHDLILKLNTNFSKITVCYELFIMSKRI